jgi:S-methylmethionine-dependent homocysteine/selenocysteine methylase
MILATALAEGPLILDGGLSTELERRGNDLSGRLWSARLLRDAPEAVVEVHAAFLRAGAQVITTASYQATPEGFAAAGYSAADGVAMLRRSVDLARQAQSDSDHRPGGEGRTPDARRTWIAGSVGPYATLLADGSEYTGDYGPAVDRQRLRLFHRPKLEILAEAGVDVLAAETVPSTLEAEALALELAALGRPAWLSLTVTTGADGVTRTRRGEPAAEAFGFAAEVDAIIAVGVNCTEPEGLATAIECAAKASGKPVVAYPNSGEGWDAQARAWTGRPSGDSGFSRSAVSDWIQAGAALIGGCCRVGPDVIADLARQFEVRTD